MCRSEQLGTLAFVIECTLVAGVPISQGRWLSGGSFVFKRAWTWSADLPSHFVSQFFLNRWDTFLQGLY